MDDMREANGNLWDFYEQPNAVVCITTNGTVKNNGEVVMGRGCAREAKDKFPHVPRFLGRWIKRHGNVPAYFVGSRLMTFPVKHNWWEQADLALIEQSAKALADKANRVGLTFYLPRPGCGNGRLTWDEVRPVIEPILPDNVVVISF